MRNERVRRALTDVFPPTVHVPRCQSPSASSFLSSASARAGGSTRRTMCAGATLGTSASATERGGASPSLTVHGRAGSDRRRPKSKLGRDGAVGGARGDDCARGDTAFEAGAGAGTVGAARGRLPSWARSNVRRRAAGTGAGALSSRWRLRESSASSVSAALVVPQTAQDRYASFSFSSVQAVHTHISTSAADQPAGAPTRPGVARTVRLALANASGSAPQTGQRLNDAHLLPIDEWA